MIYTLNESNLIGIPLSANSRPKAESTRHVRISQSETTCCVDVHQHLPSKTRSHNVTFQSENGNCLGEKPIRESMNTVLDDNKMLCLPNGERIKLKPSMRIIFEVLNLDKASPATVSRCGMVYVPSESLE